MRVAVAALVAWLCGVGLAVPVAAAAPTLDRHEVAIGDWRLSISRDRFADTVTCRLRSRDRRLL